MSLTLKPMHLNSFPILHHFWLLTKILSHTKYKKDSSERERAQLLDTSRIEILKLSDHELMVRAITGKVENAKVNAKTKRHCKRSE